MNNSGQYYQPRSADVNTPPNPSPGLNQGATSYQVLKLQAQSTNMHPEFDGSNSNSTQRFPIRGSMIPSREESISMVPRPPQQYPEHSPHQQTASNYSSYNTASGHGHAQEVVPHQPGSLHRSRTTVGANPLATVKGETPSWRKGVEYTPVSQLLLNQHGHPSKQDKAKHTFQSPFVSDNGLSRAFDHPTSKLSVVIGSSHRGSSGNTESNALGSATLSSARGRPPINLMSMSPRVEIPPMASKQLDRPSTNPRSGVSSPRMPKKRGRPFRTPGAAAKAAANRVSKSAADVYGSGNGSPKKRGRPFKVPLTHVDVPVSEPKFNVFVCEWTGCLAELHNAETLRLHIHVVHCKRDSFTKMMPCLWRQCGTATEEVLNKETQTMIKIEKTKFENRQDWEDHVETAHMLPILWYQGDGPKGTDLGYPVTKTEEELSPWLYDDHGRQVTPSVKGQKIEMGIARENNARRFKKKREGIHIVLEPIVNPEPYKKVRRFDQNENGDDMELY